MKGRSHSSCLLPRWFQFVSSSGFFFPLVPIFVTSLVESSFLFYLIYSNNFKEYHVLFHLLFHAFRCFAFVTLLSSFTSFIMFIIGASCLNNILKSKSMPHSLRSSLSKRSFALRGLSFNLSSHYRFKILRNLLRRVPLARKQNTVIWHDVISNSISKHQSNNYTSLSIEELIKLLS